MLIFKHDNSLYVRVMCYVKSMSQPRLNVNAMTLMLDVQ